MARPEEITPPGLLIKNVVVVQGIQVQEFLHDALGTLVIHCTPQENPALGSQVFFGLFQKIGSGLFFLFFAVCHIGFLYINNA